MPRLPVILQRNHRFTENLAHIAESSCAPQIVVRSVGPEFRPVCLLVLGVLLEGLKCGVRLLIPADVRGHQSNRPREFLKVGGLLLSESQHRCV